jgi:nicotinate phosphoribosyltransferase
MRYKSLIVLYILEYQSILMKFNCPSIALHTDLYQLTMAQGYWKLGLHNRPAVFDLFFRELPFHGGYAIACGLSDVIDVIEQYTFSDSDLHYLASLPAADGTTLFQADFLEALAKLRLNINLDALEEGTLVFPKEPLLRVQGPIWHCQLLETILLNIVNFSTLIATKASRVCYAAKGDPIVEFGLRRAQGPNGGLMATRAAFVGGVNLTSNVLAGKLYGIGLKGTHAHSWIMAFDSEIEAFEAYAKAMPNNGLFLVDTYHTLDGVEKAIEVGKKLKEAGHPFLGIRLDSGDLTSLSIAARELLDKSGFQETKILASSDLDEYVIEILKTKGAKIDLWGVGTRLVTSFDQPALGGVYKLVSIHNKKGVWQHKAKRTDDPNKQTIAGLYAIRRIEEDGVFMRDEMVKKSPDESQPFDLLRPIFRDGKRLYSSPALTGIQQHTQDQLAKLPADYKSLTTQKVYPVKWLATL